MRERNRVPDGSGPVRGQRASTVSPDSAGSMPALLRHHSKFIFFAASRSSGRKSGCAMAISASQR